MNSLPVASQSLEPLPSESDEVLVDAPGKEVQHPAVRAPVVVDPAPNLGGEGARRSKEAAQA